MEKIESKLYEEITESKRARRDFYEECMDCRQISFGTIDGDDIDKFYRLIDKYAESKYGWVKCFAHCLSEIGNGNMNFFASSEDVKNGLRCRNSFLLPDKLIDKYKKIPAYDLSDEELHSVWHIDHIYREKKCFSFVSDIPGRWIEIPYSDMSELIMA